MNGDRAVISAIDTLGVRIGRRVSAGEEHRGSQGTRDERVADTEHSATSRHRVHVDVKVKRAARPRVHEVNP